MKNHPLVALRSIRQNLGLTLEEAAARTGVSKPALAQIERGESSPTVNTLWRIATGLRVPLSALLSGPSAALTVAAPREEGVITDQGGKMRAWPLFPYDPVRGVEIFLISFAPGCHHPSRRHLDGVEEYLFLLSGALVLTLDGEETRLEEGQAVRFQANVPHGYANPGGEECRVYNMIFYPQGERGMSHV